MKSQTEKLEHVLDTMKASAEMQALLTLQYAVPLIPGNYKSLPCVGSREWRDKLERGEASGIDKMIAGLEKRQKKKPVYLPYRIHWKSRWAMTMAKIKTLVDLRHPKRKPTGLTPPDAASKTSDGEEVVDSYKDAHDAEIAEETTTLLHGFARQPEEWENHQSICLCICFLVVLNLILFIIYNVVKSP